MVSYRFWPGESKSIGIDYRKVIIFLMNKAKMADKMAGKVKITISWIFFKIMIQNFTP
jgi:hypothetical protein